MGNFEKLVVVVVLFLSAVVLAVSLRGGDEDTAQKNPLEAAGVLPENSSESSPRFSLDSEAKAPPISQPLGYQSPGYLLDAGSSAPRTAPAETVPGGTQPARTLAVGPNPPPRILNATRGLSPSALDEFMVYTAVEGDTWAGLTERFYGSPGYLSNLREANEGMESLSSGVLILVPVYDFHSGAGVPVPAGADLASTPRAADSSSVEGASSVPVAPAVASTYEVKDGDNLSKISKTVYGTTTRWADIYAANRDQLQSPDKLKVGMKLKVPASWGKASETLAVNTKPVEKPEVAQPAAEKQKPTEKKRRVQ